MSYLETSKSAKQKTFLNLSEATFAQLRDFKVVFNCNIAVYLVPQCGFDNVKGSNTF